MGEYELHNVFDDFPGYTDWFVGEKALEWRKRHKAGILHTYNQFESIRQVTPEIIDSLKLLNDLAPPIPEYSSRRKELIEFLNNLLEEDETG